MISNIIVNGIPYYWIRGAWYRVQKGKDGLDELEPANLTEIQLIERTKAET